MPLITPTLQTSRLLLRPFADADADAIYVLQSNARVLRYWDSPPGLTGRGRRRFWRPAGRWRTTVRAPRFAIERTDTRAFIGWCSMFQWNQLTGALGIGYCLDEPAWGRVRHRGGRGHAALAL